MRRKNLVGKRFGKLTVVSYANTTKGKAKWNVVCDCGKKTEVDGSNLTTGNTTSCGCVHSDITKKRNIARRKAYGESSFNSLFLSYKKAAAERGFEFHLSKEEFQEITKQNCFYCNSEPQSVYKGCKSFYGEYIYNGVDRVNPKEGYTIHNTVPCCKKCNFAKRDMSINDFFDWVKNIYTNFVMNKEKVEVNNED